jgi:hypothetical protein
MTIGKTGNFCNLAQACDVNHDETIFFPAVPKMNALMAHPMVGSSCACLASKGGNESNACAFQLAFPSFVHGGRLDIWS